MTGTLTWIGTATTLVSYGGFTLLTDPNFLRRGERAYLGKGLWSVRRTDPSLRLEQLPALDAVVLSHLHGDHFDRRARRGLAKDTTILTTRAAARTLRRWGFEHAIALDTWQSHTLAKPDGSTLTVTAAPGRHAPGPLRALLPPVMGSVLAFAPAGTEPALQVYVTGDTLVHDDLAEVPRRYPDLDVGLWHLGGTRIPAGLPFGALVTMDAQQGADLLALVRPDRTVPIHHGDYGVFASPVEDFLAEVARRGLAGVRPVARGGSLELPPP